MFKCSIFVEVQEKWAHNLVLKKPDLVAKNVFFTFDKGLNYKSSLTKLKVISIPASGPKASQVFKLFIALLAARKLS